MSSQFVPLETPVKDHLNLRIPDSYDVKIAEICNLWTFGPVLQLKNYLFKIRQKDFFSQCSIDAKSAKEQWAKRIFVGF